MEKVFQLTLTLRLSGGPLPLNKGTSPSSLALLYSHGISVPLDIVYAHMWANIGALGGHKPGVKLKG
tara:strand:+ start:98 stop:298 length:201 start_codon:yes stop_codon:yes gene_type:complete